MVKKGQMKIQQMAFMLIAVVIFFVLVGLFVFVIRFSNLSKTSSLVEEENARLLVTKLADSPEFACGGSFGENKLSCIDADKVMVLKKNIESYGKFWGVAEIEIRMVYPESDVICTSENYPDCGIIEVYSENVNKLPSSSNFVALCRKENSGERVSVKCALARLMVSAEDKT